MRKQIKLLLLIAFSLIFNQVVAQDSITTSRTRFGFLGSFSFPSGALASKDLSNRNAGFARAGFNNISVFGEWRLKKNQWLGFQFGGYLNPFNTTTFQEKTQMNNSGNTVSTQTGDAWRTISLMVGGISDYKISKSKDPSFLVLRSYVGIATVSSPSLFIQQTNNTNGAIRSTRQQSASSTTPVVSIDIGLKTTRKAKNGLAGFYLLVGFVFASPTFNNVPFTSTNNGLITNSTVSFRQPMSTFTISSGIDLNLKKGFLEKNRENVN